MAQYHVFGWFGAQATSSITLLPVWRACLDAANILQPLLMFSTDTWTSGMWVCSSQLIWCISFSAALGSVRSSGEATLTRTRRKPPSSPGSCFGVLLVQEVVGADGEGIPGVFGDAVVLAKVMFGFSLALAVLE